MKKKFLAALIALNLVSATVSAQDSLSLTLEDAVKIALENNRNIQRQEEKLNAAKWALSEARRKFGPKISWSALSARIGGSYYRQYRDARNDFDHNEADRQAYEERGYTDWNLPYYYYQNSHTLELEFPIYSGGLLEGQKESAKYNLNSANLNLENTRQEIKYQTKTAYFQALRNKYLIDVQQEAVNNLNEHLRIIQIQFESGLVAMGDMISTNVQLAGAIQQLNTAQGNYETAVAQLDNLLRLPPNTNLLIQGDMSYEVYEKSEEDCVAYALEHRPDGIAAVHAVKSAEATVSATKSGFRPSVTAVLQGAIAGENFFGTNHNEEQWTAGLQLNWDVFDNNVTSAQVQQAKANQRDAEAAALQQLEKIQLDVHTAYVNMLTSEKNIKVAVAAMKDSEEAYLIAQTRYVEGVDTNLAVIDAEKNLVDARNNYYGALYNYNVALASLEKAMGVPVSMDASTYAIVEPKKK